jgi:Glu-tRNA(Gln) amidotransferase subunit E-like FAD-binding protein
MRVYNKDANLIAKMITLWRNEFATKLKEPVEKINEKVSERAMEHVLEKLKEGKITEGDVKGILLKIAEGAKFEEAVKIEKMSDDELEKKITDIVKEKPGLRANAYMGMVIAKLGNIVDKRKAMEILNRIVK